MEMQTFYEKSSSSILQEPGGHLIRTLDKAKLLDQLIPAILQTEN